MYNKVLAVYQCYLIERSLPQWSKTMFIVKEESLSATVEASKTVVGGWLAGVNNA